MEKKKLTLLESTLYHKHEQKINGKKKLIHKFYLNSVQLWKYNASKTYTMHQRRTSQEIWTWAQIRTEIQIQIRDTAFMKKQGRIKDTEKVSI